jgi:hypothetical protein
MNPTRDIKYINRDFSDFKQTLIDYAKNYFPNTYNDFNDSSPAMMFIEMASYVGDVLSFYQDSQLQENLLLYAQERENLVALAYALGYRPKVTSTATAMLDVYQLVPSSIVGGVASPDFSYSLIVKKEAVIKSVSNSNISFVTQDDVNFAFSSSSSPTDVSVYQINQSSGQPDYYILKKKVNSVAGEIKTQDFSFSNPEKFATVKLLDTSIIQILDVIDSDGNKWYEVPYLAQETIFEEVQNNELNDPNLSQYSDAVPYLLRLKRVPRRFTARFTADDTMDIEFGSGVLSPADEEIIPNPDNVGMGLVDGISKLDIAFDPSNFLYTKNYGIAPSNTTLTVRYLVGGGVQSNVPANDITSISGLDTKAATSITTGLNSALLQQIKNSVAFNNSVPADGGGDGDSNEEIRLNTIASFPTQLRAVTKEDYIVRTMSLPAKYGGVAKAYIVQDQLLDHNKEENFINSNPLALSLYILSYDANRRMVTSSMALKENLKIYLSQYRMLTDAVTIKDAYFINVGVNFDIVVSPAFNASEVLSNCLSALKTHFDIDKWQINQPIIIADIIRILSNVQGVQNVHSVEIQNKYGETEGYSKYGYDVKGATLKNVVYPSLDPAVFEVRYPDSDINGRVINY